MKVRKTLIAVLTLSFTEALDGWHEDPPLRKLSSWHQCTPEPWLEARSLSSLFFKASAVIKPNPFKSSTFPKAKV